RLNGKGDRAEVMKTEVYRKFRFPEFDNEKFCPEGLIWHRISKEYDALYLCEVSYMKGTPDDSITSDVYNYLKRNCKGTSLYYYELVNDKRLTYKFRLGQLIRYYRYAPYAHATLFKGIPLKLFLIGFPLGVGVFIYDGLCSLIKSLH
ncbi:MAG: hypothetical protein J5965_08670, partial [Aeriscardovia sp.]|nr:hypothetical protein [Aeriscardovia sp.]